MNLEFIAPFECYLHEGTWLIWPHAYTYGIRYRKAIEPVWIAMVKALSPGERVHIIAYNQKEEQRIMQLLQREEINWKQLDFVIAASDDVWVRDTGPLFVYDQSGMPVIVDFAFDGWGKKAPYHLDNAIPETIAKAKGIPIIKVPSFVLEGGAVELDGAGTMMASKSSILSKNRNAELTLAQVETYVNTYLGVRHVIWLQGVLDEDITDAHIDGTARFYDDQHILTVSKQDFLALYEDMPAVDYDTLSSAHNAMGIPYQLIEVPMTANKVKGVGIKGSYLNYYVGNEVVLLPVYGDANDQAAYQLFARLFTDKKIIPIDVCALYRYGGMLHCVTQQQPICLKKGQTKTGNLHQSY